MSRIERKKRIADEKKQSKAKNSGRKARFEKKYKNGDTAEIDTNAINKAAENTKDVAKPEIKEDFKKIKKIERFKNWFKGLRTWKKALFISLTVLLVIVIIGGSLAYAFLSSVFDDIHKDTPEDYDLSLVDVDGYYNILLLGVDSRDMENIENTRSDAIMMVSINKETNDVKVLSVYRDTYLKLGDRESYDKITHACAYGGPELTMKTMNQAMDLNISNYVVVNFKAVADLVDAVGGIEVDVQDYEISQLNKYTKATANNIGRKDYKLVEKAGVQTLEGVQAVSYGRIRKGVGDDFKRTERMRTVVSLVTDKMKEMSFKELRGIIKLMTPQVQTNLSKNDILGLAVRLPKYNIVDTTGWPYNVSTGYIGGVSYVFPSNLADNVTKLHNEFFGQEDYVVSATVSGISSGIIQRIDAARQSNQLKNEEKEIEPNKEVSETPNDEPVNPENPAEPTEPADPENPAEPTEPADPDNPAEVPDKPSDNTGTDTGNTDTGGEGSGNGRLNNNGKLNNAAA